MDRTRSRTGLIVLVAVVLIATALAATWVARSGATARPTATLDLDALASYPPASLDPGPVMLSGAGDIATCEGEEDEATAALLADVPGFVFTAGDNAYHEGSPEEYEECYDPSWGQHRDRTFPATGNHDWETSGAQGYFDYFGPRAGADQVGWYATTVGAWRLIVLVSMCDEVGGCGPESDQGRWLARELERNPSECTIAIWHHPLFSTGEHGPSRGVRPLWEQLYEAGADVIVNGHDHNYERFVPLDPEGNADPERGIRQFVVGTGGAHLRTFPDEDPNSEVRDVSTHGIIQFSLDDGTYEWEFRPVPSGTFTDSGTGTCH